MKTVGEKRPVLNENNIHKLLVSQFGVQEVIAHYVRKARQASSACNSYVAANNPIAVAQKLGEIDECLEALRFIVNLPENIEDIDKIKTP